MSIRATARYRILNILRSRDEPEGTLFSDIVEIISGENGRPMSPRELKYLLEICGKLVVDDSIVMFGHGEQRRFARVSGEGVDQEEFLINAEQAPSETDCESEDERICGKNSPTIICARCRECGTDQELFLLEDSEP